MSKLPMKVPPLTAKQEMFCNEYLVDMNATQAAIRSGFDKSSASKNANKLTKNPRVIKRINELMAERAHRVDVKADGVLQELGRIGYADIRGIFKADGSGTVRPIEEWPEDLARSCASIDVAETFEMSGGERVWTGYIKKIKFWDKPRALELIGKNQKLFTDRVEHTGSLTLEALVAGSNTIEGEK